MKIVVAVYDGKAEAYGPPVLVLTKGEAIRGFESEVQNKESKLNKFKEDFSLWQIGKYDELKGEIKGLDQKINLANAWETKQDQVVPMRN